MSDELYDGNNYPTDAALERLESFEGTPAEMAEYIGSLFRNGSAKVTDSTNEWGKARKKLTLITMGWSGCESVIGTLHQTLFHHAFWELSARGGLYVYDIPEGLWESSMGWGKP